MLKKIIFVLICLVAMFVIYLAIEKQPKQIKITTVQESYNINYIESENQELKIPILINQRNAYITEFKEINNCYISDNDNIINIKIEEIEYVEKKLINKEEYFLYNFYFTIDYKDNIEMPKAYLTIEYTDERKIKLDIGSFSLYVIKDSIYNDLGICNLKGIINEIDGKKTLVGIIAEIENHGVDLINIEKIELLNVNTYISGIKILNNISIDSNMDINNLIDTPYKINSDKTDVELEIDKTKYILLVVGYHQHYEIPKLGFTFDYNYRGLKRTFTFPSFTFFENHQREIPISDLTFYTYGYN